MIHVRGPSTSGVIQVAAKETVMHIDVSKIYVLIKCVSFLVHLDNLAKRTLGSSVSNLQQQSPEVKEIPQFSLSLPSVTMNVELPTSVKGTGVFSNLTINSQPSRIISGSFDSFAAHIFKDAEGKLFELAILREVFLQTELSAGETPTVFTLDSAFSKLIVPNDWPFSNIIENGVNLTRVVKTLVFDMLEKEPSKYFDSGQTFFVQSETPTFIVRSAETIILLEDNKFESILGRNYRIGYEENLARLGREKEFMKKAKSKLPYMLHDEYLDMKRNLFLRNQTPGKMYDFFNPTLNLTTHFHPLPAVKSIFTERGCFFKSTIATRTSR